MTRFFKIAVFIATFVLMNAGIAYAESAPTVIVDVQKLLTQSTAGQSIQKQIDKHKETFLAEIGKQEQGLRDEEKKLSEERAKLSKEDFATKAKAFEEKLNEKRKGAQNRKKELEDAAAKALMQLRDKIFSVVKEIADQKGYGLVINNQNVVYGGKTLDITEESISKLNAEMSEIVLNIK